MPLETGNIVLGGIAFANIAGFVYLVKLVIAPVVESVRELTANIESLYTSRNNHADRLTKIETIHEIKGCGKPKGVI